MYLLTYKFDVTSVDEVRDMLHSLQEQYPQEIFFAIPDTISLTQCDKEQLITIKNFIDILLKEMEKED